MSPRDPAEYDSDSEDEESLDEVETSVLLGVPDGPIESQKDVDDAAVSRIGGYPAFLTGEPPIESAQCKVCSSSMELLVQLWCPFEDSTMDRAIYIFGCSRGGCQKKAGSVRAYRGLRYNKEYAEKLERKRQRAMTKEAEKAKAAELEAQAKEKAKINPFTMGGGTSSGGLFGGSFGAPTGLGSQLFGSSTQGESTQAEQADERDDEVEEPPISDEEPDDEDDSDSDSESTHSVVEAPTSRLPEASPWSAKQPAFKPPLYLSTSMEYIQPPPKSSAKLPSAEEILDDRDKEKKGGKANDADGWNAAMEGYENSLNMDHVFERFATRVSYEGEQCIRYELGGTPLPYASDAIFSALFPSPTSNVTQVTGAKFVVTPPIPKRIYDPDSSVIKHCDRCGAKRKFECQLMPNLINVLRKSSDNSTGDKKPQQQSDAERKKELESLFKGGAASGMEWGTCMVFSCEKDCCLSGDAKEAKESWCEELVLVQWEE